MANKWRGEIAFPALGKHAFISFPMEDLAELEDQFGEDFFDVIERAAAKASPKVLPQVLAIGLKSRDGDGKVSKLGEDQVLAALHDGKFDLAEVGETIMDAIAQSWLRKPYRQLVEEAIASRKEADVDAVQRAKEAAEGADVPFDAAFLEGLSKLLTALGSAPSRSGV